MASVMRAIVFGAYGAPTAVMRLARDRRVPEPGADEVLVKVEASSINAADRHMVRASYPIIRILLGLIRPAVGYRVLGMDLAGTVVAHGAEVDTFAVGDSVAADIRRSFGGGFAEYALVHAADLVKTPPGVSFADAATVPISGQAALLGLQHCGVGAGDHLLVSGASGGVGSFAVQIAKAQGAHVTALCAASKADAVRALGADVVVVTTAGFAVHDDLAGAAFDAVFDAASFGSPGDYAHALKDDGRYVLVGGSFYNMLWLKVFGRFYGRAAQRFASVTQNVPVVDNIRDVLDMVADGVVTPRIQHTVPLNGVPAAIEALEDRSVVGKIVVLNQT